MKFCSHPLLFGIDQISGNAGCYNVHRMNLALLICTINR